MPRLLTAVKVMGCLAIFFHSTIACMAFDPPGPPGPPGGNPPPPPPPLWLIQSPANNGVFPFNASISCSGTAMTNGTTWVLEIKQAGQDPETLAGSSVDFKWDGTMPKPSGGWQKAGAFAVLKVNGNKKDQTQFSFQ